MDRMRSRTRSFPSAGEPLVTATTSVCSGRWYPSSVNAAAMAVSWDLTISTLLCVSTSCADWSGG
jgi:hypothetical protein